MRTGLDSRAIRAADWRDGTLTLWFPDGDAYAYDEVPERVFAALLGAPSAGAFFAAEIRERYPNRKLRPAPPR